MITCCTSSNYHTLPASDKSCHNQIGTVATMTTPHTAPRQTWIDEETYRMSVLSLPPFTTETDIDENLQNDARELGILHSRSKNSGLDIASGSSSGTTISSQTHRNSIFSQSTAPTSCGSSARRSSTSLSQYSYLTMPLLETSSTISNFKKNEQVKNSGFKNGLKKLQGLRRKRTESSIAPPIKARSNTHGSSSNDTTLYKPRDKESPVSPEDSVNEEMFSRKNFLSSNTSEKGEELLSSLDCEALVSVRTQQLEEKRKFLEYQTKLIQDLLSEREQVRSQRRTEHAKQLAEKEKENDEAAEELEARQLEDELRQQREHEVEKKAIQVRLKHMEAYCQTPSPPLSPTTGSFDRRPSGDSIASHPERQVTQQHYENLAQVYHSRDNMDSLHASKINVLRGKQKRTLQSFISKKERELELFDQKFEKDMKTFDAEYAKKEADIRSEFETKRHALEARWKLRSLVEKARLERITGLKYDDMPDLVAVEA